MRHSLIYAVMALTFSASITTGCKSKPETTGGQEDLIKEEVQAGLEKDQEQSQIYIDKALAAIDTKDWREAATYYNGAIKHDQDNWKLYLDRAIALSKVPDFMAAISSMRQAMERGGDRSWLAWYNLGNIYQNRGMYFESTKAYRASLGLAPQEEKMNILVNLSAGYVFLGKYDEARETNTYILSLDPSEVRALHNEALVFHMQRKYDEALLAYDAVLDVDPEFAQSHFNRGHVLAALGRNAEAAMAYGRYVEIEPEGPYVTRATTRAGELRKK